MLQMQRTQEQRFDEEVGRATTTQADQGQVRRTSALGRTVSAVCSACRARRKHAVGFRKRLAESTTQRSRKCGLGALLRRAPLGPLPLRFSGLYVHFFFRDRDQRLHYALESPERGMRTGLGVLCHSSSLPFRAYVGKLRVCRHGPAYTQLSDAPVGSALPVSSL